MTDGLGKIEKEEGAVTFLDVLGWKGIWEKNQDAIVELQDLILNIRKLADEVTPQYLDGTKKNEDRTTERGESTTVLSISDTIAIFTPGDAYETLSIHAALCNYAIPESIARRIPVRGATAYGAFSTMENIMVGPAVDESASWHEATDWIGVVLTPSATFMFEHGRTPDGLDRVPENPLQKKSGWLSPLRRLGLGYSKKWRTG